MVNSIAMGKDLPFLVFYVYVTCMGIILYAHEKVGCDIV